MMVTQIVYTFEDASGDTATSTEWINEEGRTQAQIEAYVVARAEQLDAQADGRLVKAAYFIGVDISGLTGNVTDASGDIEVKARFENVDVQGRRFIVSVPAVADNFTLPGSDDLDTADPAVAALITALEDGLNGIVPVSIDDEANAGVLSAQEISVARRRRRGGS